MSPSVLWFDFKRTQGVWGRERKSSHPPRVSFNSTNDTHQWPAVPKSYFPAFTTTLHLVHPEITTAKQPVTSHLWNKHQMVWSGTSLLGLLFALGQRSREYCYTNCISLLRTCGKTVLSNSRTAMSLQGAFMGKVKILASTKSSRVYNFWALWNLL